jgi:HEAT repeat protein
VPNIDVTFRFSVAQALGSLGEPNEASQLFIEILEDVGNRFETRSHAIMELERHGTGMRREIVDSLLRILDSSVTDKDFRKAAVQMLSRFALELPPIPTVQLRLGPLRCESMNSRKT